MLGKMMVSMLALTGVAYAQETSPPPSPGPDAPGCAPAPTCAVNPVQSSADRIVYDAAFFTQFNPQTALDMVRQTPGFTLEAGEERRGFSGAVGNLLIDSLRPSAKSQSLESILQRIPASQVVRLEVLRGGAVAGDASGQSTLLNIVRTPTAGSGLWSLGLGLENDNVRPEGSLSYSGRNGQFEYGIGADYYQDTRSQPGRRELHDATGAITNIVQTPSPRNYREASINGNVAFPLLGGRVSSTGQVSWFRWHADHRFITYDHPSGDLEDNFFDAFTEWEPSFELGVNYDRDFGPWSMALVGLATRAYYRNAERINDYDGAGAFIGSAFLDLERDTGESILRGTLSRALGEAHRIEFGAEGAINTLDNVFAFIENDVVQAIPNSNVTVEEQRAEVFAVDTWSIAPNWTLETRIARESSTLTFTGDTNQTVDLAYIKPSVQLSHTFGGNNQVRLRYYRDVGQLDFDDFVSAAAVADNLVDGGNPDLKPDTSWRAELGADFRFPGDAALSLTYTHYWLEDVADLVKLESDNGTPLDPSDDFFYDAPGNIGDGSADRIDANLSMPLNFLLPNSRLTLSGYLWRGEVTDPVTGRQRTLSEHSESQFDLEFRQDFSARKLAYGFSATKPGEVQYYRHNEIDTQEEGPWIDGWIETTALPGGARLRFSAVNIFSGDISRDRRFYAGDRNGPLLRWEDRHRHFEDSPWYEIELSATF